MTILREDLDAGRIDFSDLEGECCSVPPTHPGEILFYEFMEPLAMSVAFISEKISVSATLIEDIVRGRSGITAEMALRLGRFFGTSAELWLGLQKDYELRLARTELDAYCWRFSGLRSTRVSSTSMPLIYRRAE